MDAFEQINENKYLTLVPTNEKNMKNYGTKSET